MSGYKKIITSWFLLIIMMISTQAHAAAESEFKKGLLEFKSENYYSAAHRFESARRQGMKNTALYYNLGSAYFKIKNYKRAEVFFSALINHPKMQSLIEYNLGLIAQKRNQIHKAKEYFKVIVNHSNDKKIIYLAKKQLKIINVPRKKWSIYLNGSVGFNNNINFSPIGIGTEESGNFADALISTNVIFSGTRINGWSAEAMFYTLRYADTENPGILQGTFDQDQYGAALKKTQKLGDWETQIKVGFDQSTFGPRDYQSVAKFEINGKYRLSPSGRMMLRYSYADISSDDALFDYIDGSRQKLRVGYLHYQKNSSTQLYYELELNDRSDFVSNAGNEFSYSPTRHTIRGKYTAKFNSTWQLVGDLSYRMSDFPVTTTQNRQDDRAKAALHVNYNFTKSTRLKLKVEYTDNSSSDSLYVYDRQVTSLSLSTFF